MTVQTLLKQLGSVHTIHSTYVQSLWMYTSELNPLQVKMRAVYYSPLATRSASQAAFGLGS